MSRYRFHEIFTFNPDETLSSVRLLNVNGMVFGEWVSFGPGISFGGINFHNYKHLDIAGEEQDGVLKNKGFYKHAA